jgi:hypothetical protein
VRSETAIWRVCPPLAVGRGGESLVAKFRFPNHWLASLGRGNEIVDGEVRLEAARLLGLNVIPCVRIDHLSPDEQRVLRLAVNRLGENGEWNLEELRIEFEELILSDARIEITGFTLDEIDQIVLGDPAEAVELGPLEPERNAIAIARLGDVFALGPHRLVCGDATIPETLRRLVQGDPPARLVLTDEPYNVPIAGHVSGGAHREFAMASGEMTDAEFLAFNEAWMQAYPVPSLRRRRLLHLHRLAGLIDGLGRLGKVGPQAAQLDRLDENQRRHVQSLPLAA